MNKLNVCWLSSGVSSCIAGYIAKDEIDKFIYIDVADQHPDSMRFIIDSSKILGKEIEILRDTEYGCVENVCRARHLISTRIGAPCTMILKKRVRKKWEYEHSAFDITYFWGFDYDEQSRADRIVEAMPQFTHRFPLIEQKLTKQDAHAICKEIGLKRPAMYDLGYNNNNCIGCIKGGKGYWNKIRVDFPDVFEKRAKLERDIGASILKDKTGRIFLDELSPDSGREQKEILEDCGIACELFMERN